MKAINPPEEALEDTLISCSPQEERQDGQAPEDGTALLLPGKRKRARHVADSKDAEAGLSKAEQRKRRRIREEKELKLQRKQVHQQSLMRALCNFGGARRPATLLPNKYSKACAFGRTKYTGHWVPEACAYCNFSPYMHVQVFATLAEHALPDEQLQLLKSSAALGQVRIFIKAPKEPCLALSFPITSMPAV